MSKNKQDKKDKGEKEHVRRVLDYHNKKYETHIKIDGKTQDVRPELEGESDWDWVCHDEVTCEEIAVECKSLRDQLLSEKGNITWQFLEKVRDSLLGKLPGTYHLFVNIPNGYRPPLKQQDREDLLDLLCTIIPRTATKLQVGGEADLKRKTKLLLQTKKKMEKKFYIPNTILFKLQKISNDGSLLTLGSGQTYGIFQDFDDIELKEFEGLVSQANTQLQKAKVRDTFLVLIEVHSAKEPQVIAEALKRINPNSYSRIKYIYLTGYGKVTEIPLPTPLPAP